MTFADDTGCNIYRAIYTFNNNAYDELGNYTSESYNITYERGIPTERKYAVFNGSDSKIVLPDDFVPISGNFAISLLIYINREIDIPQVILEFKNGCGLSFPKSTGYDGSSCIVAQYENAPYKNLASGSRLLVDNWYHIVANFDVGTSCELYIDGIKQINNIEGFMTSQNNTIGARRSQWGTANFKGKLGNLIIYNGKLNQNAIAKLFSESNKELKLPYTGNVNNFVDTYGLQSVKSQPFANQELSKNNAEMLKHYLYQKHKENIKTSRQRELTNKSITVKGYTMKLWYTTYGTKPSEGRSLWISMHGGGTASASTNDNQWNNQKILWRPSEGVYVAPRAVFNSWNMWSTGINVDLFEHLIESMIVIEDVNPNKVYIVGYSAGGDGVYALGTRMADRWAGCLMGAGHPGTSTATSLLNTPFAIYMGGDDSRFQRNDIAKQWKKEFIKLKNDNPSGYDNKCEIIAGKGHSDVGGDANRGISWLETKTRNPRPEYIIWKLDYFTYNRFYWIYLDFPRSNSKITARMSNQKRENQTITLITTNVVGIIRIRLDDEMFDLDSNIKVVKDGNIVFNSVPKRTVNTLLKTILERGDPSSIFSAEIVIN